MTIREIEEIKREAERTSIARPTKNKYLKFLLGTLLVLTGIGVLAIAFLGGAPDTVMCINPMNDFIPTFFAYLTMLLILPGLVCIFVKSIRRPLLIITCIVLITFFIMAMFNAAINKIAYNFAKGKEAVERPCVITFHKGHHDKAVADERMEDINTYILVLHYLDTEADEVISQNDPIKNYNNLYEGDTCVAYVKDGILGIKFVTNIKCVKHKTQVVNDEESDGDDNENNDNNLEDDEDFKD